MVSTNKFIPPPKASRTDLEPKILSEWLELRPSYLSTGSGLGQISPKYVISQILVQNGDFFVCKVNKND